MLLVANHSRSNIQVSASPFPLTQGKTGRRERIKGRMTYCLVDRLRVIAAKGNLHFCQRTLCPPVLCQERHNAPQ